MDPLQVHPQASAVAVDLGTMVALVGDPFMNRFFVLEQPSERGQHFVALVTLV